MKITVKLFPVDIKASDGSIIPKKVFLDYINSKDYNTRLESKLALGGVTHGNRNESNADTGLGEFDDLLISGNITHYMTKMYLKDDGFVYAEAVVMDDSNMYEGKSKELVLTLLRLLKENVMLPVSIVIKAYWSPNDIAEEIVFISGFDITLSPGYSGAAIIRIED